MIRGRMEVGMLCRFRWMAKMVLLMAGSAQTAAAATVVLTHAGPLGLQDETCATEATGVVCTWKDLSVPNFSGDRYVHRITSDVTVPAGTTLVIYSGARVEFAGNHELLVNGTLSVHEATGFVSISPAVFTSATNPDAPEPGSWKGIRILGGTLDNARMEMVRILGATNALHLENVPKAVAIYKTTIVSAKERGIFLRNNELVAFSELRVESVRPAAPTEGWAVDIPRHTTGKVVIGLGSFVQCANGIRATDVTDLLVARTNFSVIDGTALRLRGSDVLSKVTVQDGNIYQPGVGVDSQGVNLTLERTSIMDFKTAGIELNAGGIASAHTAWVRNNLLWSTMAGNGGSAIRVQGLGGLVSNVMYNTVVGKGRAINGIFTSLAPDATVLSGNNVTFCGLKGISFAQAQSVMFNNAFGNTACDYEQGDQCRDTSLPGTNKRVDPRFVADGYSIDKGSALLNVAPYSAGVLPDDLHQHPRLANQPFTLGGVPVSGHQYPSPHHTSFSAGVSGLHHHRSSFCPADGSGDHATGKRGCGSIRHGGGEHGGRGHPGSRGDGSVERGCGRRGWIPGPGAAGCRPPGFALSTP